MLVRLEQALAVRLVDERGESLGLVALEDILEELVGEIRDESTRATEPRDGRLTATPADA